MPQCSDCHGNHDILPSTAQRSSVHPTNLPDTCGRCHENLDITTKYDILIDHPIQIYSRSVHGKATKGGVYVAASCNDCHSTGRQCAQDHVAGLARFEHQPLQHPATCGKCHKGIENDFWEGIHGQLVARGETDAPVCTDCHGEHGILSPDDPLSPVSGSKVAEMTCSPCHESAVLNEKYDIKTGRLTTFIDSYHGLKSKAGDTHVANCASCHGVHRILPSSDPTSTVNPANLRTTCGECHPNISKMASTPIHGIGGQGLRTPAADVIEKIYIVAIAVIIGLMILHWVIDLIRHLVKIATKRPQILRLHIDEVVQHMLLAITFITLTISGFALLTTRDSWHSSSAGKVVSRFEGFSTERQPSPSWEPSSGTSCFSCRADASSPRHDADPARLPVLPPANALQPRSATALGVHPAFQLCGEGRVLGSGLGHHRHGDHRSHAVVRQLVHPVPPQGRSRHRAGHPLLGGLAGGADDLRLALLLGDLPPQRLPDEPELAHRPHAREMYKHEHPGHLEEARRETEKVIEKRIERMRRRKYDPDALDRKSDKPEFETCETAETKSDAERGGPGKDPGGNDS